MLQPGPEDRDPAPAAVLDCLVRAAAAAQTAAAATWLLDDGDCLVCAAGCGLPAGWPAEKRVLQSQMSLWSAALAAGVAFAEPADRAGSASLPPGCTSALCVPLRNREQPLGLLCVYRSAPPELTENDAEALRALADLAAAGLAATARLAAAQREQAERTRLQQVVSHELRSPIAVAQSLLRNVLRGYAGPLSDTGRDVLSRVSRQLDALGALIDDYLDLAASRATVTLSAAGPVVVNTSLARAVLLIEPRAEEKGVRLQLRQCPEELVVWATEEGLDHIFSNLVDNAVKYTPAGGSVTAALRRSGPEAVAVVADTGIGIPPEAIPHLFEEFYRAANARAVKAVGTGLGLAIVKELVDRFAGQIEVASAPGEGATFTVRLPLHLPG